MADVQYKKAVDSKSATLEKRLKAAIITADSRNATRVFTQEIRAELRTRYELVEPILCKKELEKNPSAAHGAEVLFATWGMERFSAEEIRKFFPNLKQLYYAAGSVQGFAKEFMDLGIRVFSAWQANAVPVAEFTFAQIQLAAKGFFRAARHAKFCFPAAARYAEKCGGNYGVKVGIIGVGCIGKSVARKLADTDAKVYYYDPFLDSATAEELGIEAVTLEELFTECDVITNHLANKPELAGVLSGALFNRMKPYATFINTGRGRQVDEKGLARALRKVKTRTALLDVTAPEPILPFGRIARRKNIIVTPHIAGSLGREVVRMARYMLDEADRIETGMDARYEVSVEMLATMA